MLNTTQQQMKEEILNELQQDEDTTLDDIRDNVGEWVDGYMPIYYNQIVKEWQEMPSEYDDRGAEELGTTGGIYDRMGGDLYLYYTDLFHEVLEEIESEQEESE